MTTTLVKFDEARRALAVATSIDEVKDIRDKAEALRTYIRQQGASLEMQNQCAEIKLRAERRAGEILREQEKATGTRNQLAGRDSSGGSTVLPPEKETSTLAEFGINKTQSSRWQQVADLPTETFEQHIAETKAKKKELTSASVYRLIKKRKKEKKQVASEAKTELYQGMETIKLICGDFAEVGPTLAASSFDAIITDPPYPKKYLPLYGLLAEQAAHLLKPGGSLLAMAGQSYLPEIFNLMTPHLRYNWTVAYLTPGGQAVQLWQRNVNSFWKPVLWFIKGKYTGKWAGDVATSKVNDNDKRFHHWGQSESGMADLVRRFSEPNDLILDPFCGGGTTGVVCYDLSRQFVGIDIDIDAIEASKQRLVVK